MSRLDRATRARVAAASARLAARLGEALPAAVVTAAADGATVAGPELARDRLAEPALRWPAGLWR